MLKNYKVEWKRLFVYIKDEGVYANAVVSFAQFPCSWYTTPLVSGTIGSMVVVAQYKRTLVIDLWLVKFAFYWRSKHKYD